VFRAKKCFVLATKASLSQRFAQSNLHKLTKY
jgi:hypothetical protein